MREQKEQEREGWRSIGGEEWETIGERRRRAEKGSRGRGRGCCGEEGTAFVHRRGRGGQGANRVGWPRECLEGNPFRTAEGMAVQQRGWKELRTPNLYGYLT